MSTEAAPINIDSASIPADEVKPQPAVELDGLSPMPQFGETPMAPWAAQPIAPPLPSARNLAPTDFQQQFLNSCLYTGNNVLEEGATAFSAPGIPDGTDLMFKANGAQVGGPSFASLLQPPAQPDYFGHLLGHPMNPSLYEDDSVNSDADDSNDECDDSKSDQPQESPKSKEESPVGKAKDKATPELAPVEEDEDDASSEDSGDDDVDYFGHIMGHPMNVGSGSQKTPKSKKKSKKKKSKTEKLDSDEPQVSVLNLFLGGVEVCDREENLSHFAKNEDDSSMEMSKEEEGPIEDGNNENADEEDEEKIDQSAFESSPIKDVSALMEEPSKIEAPVESPKVEPKAEEEPEKTVEPEKTAEPVAPRVVEPAPAPRSVARPIEEVKTASQSPKELVVEQSYKRPQSSTNKISTKENIDKVVEDTAISGRVRSGPAATTKKKSFFGSLCGSKN